MPRARVKKWRPIGPDESVVMDKEHPYVGDQSPRIKLAGSSARGIQQSELVLKKGMTYTGRVILAGTADAKISVSLIWGTGPDDRQTVSIPAIKSVFAKYPLNFASTAGTTAGRLEITGTGTGSFRIGAVSLMPTDNILGFRPDTIRLLHDLDSGMWRLPGGNSLSDHDWRDAIGDPDKRPPTYDYAFSSMQPNDVGMDEFMTMCKLMNVEPYITVSSGFADPRSSAELVEYINGSTSTRMGALRAANGHPEPYKVKIWDIGNEMYGHWQIGHTYLRYYTIKHNFIAHAMLKADPTITLIGCGAMPDEMTVTGTARLITGKAQAEFGTESDWTGGMLANCMETMDGLAEHMYCSSGHRYDVNFEKDKPFPMGVTTNSPDNYGYVPVTESLHDWARRPSNRVRLKYEAWEEYKKRFPEMIKKKLFLAIDEWGYFGTRANLKLSLAFAMSMQEMFRHSDFIKMSAFTFGPSTLNISPTDAAYNTSGLMFKIYKDHFGTIPVEVGGNSPQPAPKWPVGGDQPAVNAGSPTYPLDLVAAFTADKKFLTVAVVNCTENAHPLQLNLKGVSASGKTRMWQLTGPAPDSANVLGQKPVVEILEVPVTDPLNALTIPPLSLSIYNIPV
jgi:alpha-N-arabinofuranosidase